MKNIKIYLYLLLLYMPLSCNNENKATLNTQIVNYIKSDKYETHYESAFIPKFILDDLVDKNDPNTYFQDIESVKKNIGQRRDVLPVIPYGVKYLHTVLLSENVCLISYNISGDIFSTDYVDFYIFKNPKFHKRFKAVGVVNSKERLIDFFKRNRDFEFIEDFKY